MRNIVLIVVDTLRPDRLGCGGYRRPTSPHLDRLAAEGAVFDAMWSASNYTAPAFTSLFTGLHPHEHGIFDFTAQAGGSAVFDAVRAAGLATGGVVTFRFFRNLLRHAWGELEAVTDGRSFDYAKDLPLAVTDGALEWLDRRDPARPFGLFLHYDGPHMPYRLPPQYAALFDTPEAAGVAPDLVATLFPQQLERLEQKPGPTIFRLIEAVEWGRRRLTPADLAWLRDKYDACVRYNDEAIGRFLAGLTARGLADETVVCVLSDHGEAFCEHGSFSHGGIDLHEEIVRTVGIVRDPGRPAVAGRRFARPVSHVDVWPTLLRLAGVPWPTAGFSDLLDGAPDGDGPPVFCQGKAKAAVRRGNLKAIVARPNPGLARTARLRTFAKLALRRRLGTQLYDLAADPGETRNLAHDRALAAPLRRLLREHLATVRPAVAAGAGPDEAERRRIEQEMRDLGYL
ncbi:MAG: sulfatase [Krumholzibacteria bacterium]|nr:sulfatase [Candidatus Krumholzibacteria bacterium]